jgi:hypothetical protein
MGYFLAVLGVIAIVAFVRASNLRKELDPHFQEYRDKVTGLAGEIFKLRRSVSGSIDILFRFDQQSNTFVFSTNECEAKLNREFGQPQPGRNANCVLLNLIDVVASILPAPT